MFKDGQVVIGLKIYENEATQNKHVKEKKKTNKNQGFQITASCTLEQVCVRMSLACMRRLDHVYADPYLENLINTKIEQKPNKIENCKSSNLTC